MTREQEIEFCENVIKNKFKGSDVNRTVIKRKRIANISFNFSWDCTSPNFSKDMFLHQWDGIKECLMELQEMERKEVSNEEI